VAQHRGRIFMQPAIDRVKGELYGFKIGCWRDVRTSLVPRDRYSSDNGGRTSVLRDFADFTNLEEPTNRYASDESAGAEKVGPVSWAVPWDVSVDGKATIQDGCNRFFVPHPTKLDDSAADYATCIVRSLSNAWGRRLIEPLPLKEAIFRFQGKHDFGFPYFSSNPDECFYDAYEQSYLIVRHLDLPRALSNPALLGSRQTSRGRGKPGKGRVILRCSRRTNNVAKMLFEALHPLLKLHPSFAAWYGPHGVDVVMERLMSRSRGPYLSGDFENFDASVSRDVLNIIFSVIRDWFVPEAHALVNLVRDEFNACGLIIPGRSSLPDLDILIGRGGGIPSGHVLTNLVGSLVNMWSMAYAAFKTGCRLAFCLVQGDDGVYVFDGAWSKDALSIELARDTGLVLHVDKSLVSDTRILFCSMIHEMGHMNGAGVRLFTKVMSNALSRERAVSKSYADEMDVIRWISQWDDAKYHPCFERACHWLTLKLGQVRSVSELISASGGLLASARAFYGGANAYNLQMLQRLGSSKTVAAMYRTYDI